MYNDTIHKKIFSGNIMNEVVKFYSIASYIECFGLKLVNHKT